MGVSMRDVAAAASVSVGTVSNVLNSPGKVSPSTVARVQAAIDQLGFVRNDAARQLRAGRSRCVGMVVLDVGNPFFTDIARAAERRAGDHDLTVLLGTSDDDESREQAYLDTFDEQRVFGLLVSPIGDDLRRFDSLRRHGTPVILVDRDAGGSPSTPSPWTTSRADGSRSRTCARPGVAGSSSSAGHPDCGRSPTACAAGRTRSTTSTVPHSRWFTHRI